MIDSGDSKKITIEGISSNAGFASRSKFIDAFKEQTGITPSAYIKSLEIE
jgi:AraC-like DNA-binding protein